MQVFLCIATKLILPVFFPFINSPSVGIRLPDLNANCIFLNVFYGARNAWLAWCPSPMSSHILPPNQVTTSTIRGIYAYVHYIREPWTYCMDSPRKNFGKRNDSKVLFNEIDERSTGNIAWISWISVCINIHKNSLHIYNRGCNRLSMPHLSLIAWIQKHRDSTN